MSTEQVKEEIAKFLETTTPEVLCIRGNWGTGKTYNWKTELQKARDREHGIALETYSYVSLFGVNTLSEVKLQILQTSSTRSHIGKTIDVESMKAAMDTLDVGLRKVAAWGLQLIGKNQQDAALSALSLSISKKLVCIDDLERKGPGLRTADILGFISYLKEERDCKVVLLLNDEVLKGADKSEFAAYLEKVVDINLKFAPSPAESADIAILGADDVSALVRARSTDLGIDNVRVIRKIYRLVRLIEPMLKAFTPGVLMSIIPSLVLFGWAHYQPEIAPTTEFLRDNRSLRAEDPKKDGPVDPKYAKWRQLLEEYGHRYTSHFDLVLIDGVADGFFKQEIIDRHATELDQLAAAQRAKNELHEKWKAFHRSLTNTADDIIVPLHECFIRNIAFYTLNDLNSLITLSRGLGRPDLGDDMLNKFLDAKKNVAGAFDLGNLYLTAEEDLPEDVREAFVKASTSQTPQYGADELFLRLRRDGYNNDANLQLAALPVDEYIRVFTTYQGEEFDDIITGVRQWLNLGNPSEAITTIMDKSGEALIEIGKRSPVNAFRVSRWGLVERLNRRRRMAAKAAEQTAHTDGAVPT
jgi:hypothetical protein